jgi:hypothetical protein
MQWITSKGLLWCAGYFSTVRTQNTKFIILFHFSLMIRIFSIFSSILTDRFVTKNKITQYTFLTDIFTSFIYTSFSPLYFTAFLLIKTEGELSTQWPYASLISEYKNVAGLSTSHFVKRYIKSSCIQNYICDEIIRLEFNKHKRLQKHVTAVWIRIIRNKSDYSLILKMQLFNYIWRKS